MVGCAITLFAGLWALFPREWASGVNLEMYRRLGEDESQHGIVGLKTLHLNVISRRNGANQRMLAKRERFTAIAMAGLFWEYVSLIGVLVQTLT